ncbi:UDP-2,3-diacylglucosamine hydrolase [Malaciobacter halophilus]|uniref:UDP-2,3-diacylglucosamine hydrolase n=1 Tax=Malaciobacter halophilus TaxID=197482 RepID=A0A2N1J0C7_9BACT|nr:UDP-2,3-diacylglucosamine diphosphatase [Malaciobacter halophilus]AXH10971.1 YbbF/LpxH family metallophosphatase [Malaciobacter halophilus]PKI80007.1 UDP-2,3-diacylglucosamine hydrolase [Malaciobacter halophilus]
MKYKSIFISDIHLGTRFSKAKKLLHFLKNNDSENLILVGDIIDGWAIKRKFVWPQTHSDVIQKILKKARKGCNVTFITGNHDEFLRPFVPLILGNCLHISNELEYKALNGKRYYITHGDFFDSITMTKKWLAILGDYGYDLLLYLNVILNFLRQKIGIKKYWSLSKYVKDSVKSSVSFINDFEAVLSNHAKNKGFDGIICGHIHKAEIRKIESIEYLNCGDWVESCTAIAETFEGEFIIIDWLDK